MVFIPRARSGSLADLDNTETALSSALMRAVFAAADELEKRRRIAVTKTKIAINSHDAPRNVKNVTPF